MASVVREQLVLRLLVIAGTALYILYYFLYPEVPLWDAIFTSVIMGFANLYVINQVMLERTLLRMSDDEKQLFDAFETLNPGQFRHLLKHAQWNAAIDRTGTILTREDQPCSGLNCAFLGEIAYVLNRETTATTIAPAGSRYVRWDTTDLGALSKKKPVLGNALNALLTRDLARKRTKSYQPSSALPANEETQELPQNAKRLSTLTFGKSTHACAEFAIDASPDCLPHSSAQDGKRRQPC